MPTKPHTQVTVTRIADCDLCSDGTPAYADVSLPKHNGSWGNLCQKHYTEQGCSLGLGRGQVLVLATKTN